MKLIFFHTIAPPLPKKNHALQSGRACLNSATFGWLRWMHGSTACAAKEGTTCASCSLHKNAVGEIADTHRNVICLCRHRRQQRNKSSVMLIRKRSHKNHRLQIRWDMYMLYVSIWTLCKRLLSKRCTILDAIFDSSRGWSKSVRCISQGCHVKNCRHILFDPLLLCMLVLVANGFLGMQ